MKKFIRKILFGVAVSVYALILTAVVVLAVPSNVSFQVPNPSDTSVVLKWTEVTPAPTYYIIRYSTNFYPATPASDTLSYNGTGNQHEETGLTPGQTYYFSIWAFDGAYSPSAGHCVVTTLPVPLKSGGEEPGSATLPTPTVPVSANQSANVSGFQLEPFTSIVRYFITNNATSPGGLGMPEGNAWEALFILGIVGAGSITYIKMRNFFVAFFVVFVVTCLGAGLHIVQGYLVGAEIIVGMGVWAIDKSFQ